MLLHKLINSCNSYHVALIQDISYVSHFTKMQLLDLIQYSETYQLFIVTHTSISCVEVLCEKQPCIHICSSSLAELFKNNTRRKCDNLKFYRISIFDDRFRIYCTNALLKVFSQTSHVLNVDKLTLCIFRLLENRFSVNS